MKVEKLHRVNEKKKTIREEKLWKRKQKNIDIFENKKRDRVERKIKGDIEGVRRLPKKEIEN